MSGRIRGIVHQTYEHISEDTKLVRLATVTKLIHSTIFLFFMGMNIYAVMMKITEGVTVASGTSRLFLRIADNFPVEQYIGRIIGLGILLVIGYYLFPPVGEAAIIYYLDDPEKKGSGSIAKGLGRFFPMLEFNSMISMFTPLLFIIFISRFRILDILGNGFVLFVIILRGLVALFVSVFFPFCHYFIVLEGAKPIESMGKSFRLVLENLGTVIRAVFLQFFLSLRFIINICLFFGIPLLIFYGRMHFSGGDFTGVIATILIIVAVVLGLLLAYINGIIEAFFTNLRYRLFVQLKQ